MTTVIELPLRGAGGEPVDLQRTIYSHGLTSLPPMRTGEDASWLEVTLALGKVSPRVVRIEPGRSGTALLTVFGRAPGSDTRSAIVDAARHVLRLDEDLSAFYGSTADDPELSWVTRGAGRMVRSQTVFEDVVKTICTTNCSWALTTKMVTALVEHLGRPAARLAGESAPRRSFPTPEAMAARDESFYRETVRAGYRAPHFVTLATKVAEGEIDLESWGRLGPDDLPDEDLAERLLALPGVGPYACAHIMLMMGRYSRLILDSWSRPTYARLRGKRKVADSTIERRFRSYGRYAGLAFWLFLTKGWLEERPELG